jgi:phage shock protein A
LIQPSDIAKASEAKISALSETRERARATLDAFDSEIARLKGEKESLRARILEIKVGHSESWPSERMTVVRCPTPTPP